MRFRLNGNSTWFFLIILFSIFILLPFHGFSQSGRFDSIPVKGIPTMVDLGATACVPCKMMAPILEKLEKEYRGKAAIIFIDVWKDSQWAREFGIQLIPTQIFFDKDGNEVGRHEGFLQENTIVQILEGLMARIDQTETIKNLSNTPMPVVEQPNESFFGNPLVKFYALCGLIVVIMAAWIIKDKVRNYRAKKT